MLTYPIEHAPEMVTAIGAAVQEELTDAIEQVLLRRANEALPHCKQSDSESQCRRIAALVSAVEDALTERLSREEKEEGHCTDREKRWEAFCRKHADTKSMSRAFDDLAKGLRQ